MNNLMMKMMFAPAVLNSAVGNNDLLSDKWTKGNLTTIPHVVSWLGYFSVIILSLAGFITIISAITKPAFLLMYLSNKKLWDKVDDIKEQGVQAASGMKTGNKAVAQLGSAIAWLLNLLPNVKSLTQYDTSDGETGATEEDVKKAALKTCGMAVVFVIIGTFVYYGYHAQVAGKFADGSRQLMDYALLDLDVGELVSKQVDSLANINFMTDNPTTMRDKVANQTAHSMYAAINSALGDVKKKGRQYLATTVETYVMGHTSDWQGVDGNDGWKINVNSFVSDKIDNSGAANWKPIGADGYYNISTDGKTQTYVYQMSLAGLETGSANQGDVQDKYCVTKIVLTKQAKSLKSGGGQAVLTAGYRGDNKNGKLDVGVAAGKVQVGLEGATITCELKSGGTETFRISRNGDDFLITSPNKSINDIKPGEYNISGFSVKSKDGWVTTISKLNMVNGAGGGKLSIAIPGSTAVYDTTLASFMDSEVKEKIQKLAEGSPDSGGVTPTETPAQQDRPQQQGPVKPNAHGPVGGN